MELKGYFTKQGLALAAKLASGATLKITRVMAGAGKTKNPAAAAALPLPKQQLAVNPPLRRENTAVLPVTLTAALASSAYELTELGVYAQDPSEGEILYKLYQLPEAMKVDPTSCLVLRFYLEETVSQDLGVTVSCSPAGLITESDFAPVRDRVTLTAIPSRTMRLAASELQAAINALPRLLTESLTLEVSGELNTAVDVSGFYGPGVLTIAAGGEGFLLRNQMRLRYCSVYIYIKNIEFQERAGMAGNTGLILAERCGSVYAYGCGFTGLGAESQASGVEATGGSQVWLGAARISGCRNAVLASRTAVLSMDRMSEENPSEFWNNVSGVYVWNGGIALLGAGLPATLGGSANRKAGGLIARADGTLL